MKLAKGLVALASASLMTAPLAAQAEEADFARTASPVAESDGLAGNADMFVFLALLGAVIVGALVAMDDGDEADLPASP